MEPSSEVSSCSPSAGRVGRWGEGWVRGLQGGVEDWSSGMTAGVSGMRGGWEAGFGMKGQEGVGEEVGREGSRD